jgi:hypothetical protein
MLTTGRTDVTSLLCPDDNEAFLENKHISCVTAKQKLRHSVAVKQAAVSQFQTPVY